MNIRKKESLPREVGGHCPCRSSSGEVALRDVVVSEQGGMGWGWASEGCPVKTWRFLVGSAVIGPQKWSAKVAMCKLQQHSAAAVHAVMVSSMLGCPWRSSWLNCKFW